MLDRRFSCWPLGSLFLAGFEASWLRKPDGRHLDLLKATQHDQQAREDYAWCAGSEFEPCEKALAGRSSIAAPTTTSKMCGGWRGWRATPVYSRCGA
jgi:hypothetical protein